MKGFSAQLDWSRRFRGGPVDHRKVLQFATRRLRSPAQQRGEGFCCARQRSSGTCGESWLSALSNRTQGWATRRAEVVEVLHRRDSPLWIQAQTW